MRTTVDLYAGGRVAVSAEPAASRWPEHEGLDRLVVPLGIVALALARSQEAVIDAVHGRLRLAARAIATEGEHDPQRLVAQVSGLELTRRGEPGDPRIVVQLLRSALGPVPTVGRASPGSRSLASAAAAALGVFLAPMESDVRLASALAIEGLLGWYRVADPHLQPPQQAIAYALRHSAARLSEEGRALPAELSAAITEHRKIAPMAGGA